MADIDEPTGPALGQLMINRFIEWVNNSKRHEKLYSGQLSPGAGDIIKAALMELQIYRPYYWNVWWLKNHMRFRNLGVTQVERRTLDVLMYDFLVLYSKGRFDEKTGSKRKRHRSKKSA